MINLKPNFALCNIIQNENIREVRYLLGTIIPELKYNNKIFCTFNKKVKLFLTDGRFRIEPKPAEGKWADIEKENTEYVGICPHCHKKATLYRRMIVVMTEKNEVILFKNTKIGGIISQFYVILCDKCDTIEPYTKPSKEEIIRFKKTTPEFKNNQKVHKLINDFIKGTTVNKDRLTEIIDKGILVEKSDLIN
ncbi:MAG: hypothetical protein QXN16_02160 [Candidatus Micrarchaeaceae archaeon]